MQPSNLKGQLPFPSTKPPFVPPIDYHRFSTTDPRQDAEAVVFKSPVSLVPFLFKACFFFFSFQLVLEDNYHEIEIWSESIRPVVDFTSVAQLFELRSKFCTFMFWVILVRKLDEMNSKGGT